MKTKSWTGTAEAGYIEDVLTLSSKIKITTETSSQTLGLIYAVYMMQSLAEKKIVFTAYDEEGKEIAMYSKQDDKIVAKSELHEAISSMYFILNRERGVMRHDIAEMLKKEYNVTIPVQA